METRSNKKLFVDMEIKSYLTKISYICRQIDNFGDMAESTYFITPYILNGMDSGVSQLIEIMCNLKLSYYNDGKDVKEEQ